MKTDPLFTHLNTTLQTQDVEFLKLLYQFRCLTVISDAFRFFFSKIFPSVGYCEDRLQALCENGLIEMTYYPPEEQEVIFLTQLGVDYVEACVAKERNPIYGSMKSARQLRVNGRMIKHQLAVNTTALDLLETADRLGVKYRYYDKLLAPASFGGIPSDGILILENRIVLLGIDTGSLRGDKLDHQWDSYRNFFDRLPQRYNDYAVTILIVFVSDDDYDAGSDTRRCSIARSACNSGLVTELDGKINLYAVDRNHACDLLEDNFDVFQTNFKMMRETAPSLAKEFHFNYYYTTDLLSEIECALPSCYICRSNNDDTIDVEDGRSAEYLIDFWADGRLSVLNTILNIERIENALRNSYLAREIPYVVVVPDMRTVLRVMKSAGVSAFGKVYFTTPSRLKRSRSFPAALFRIDEELVVWGYHDNSLKHAIFERKLHPYTNRTD